MALSKTMGWRHSSMPNQEAKEQGLTLLEVLAALMIFSIILITGLRLLDYFQAEKNELKEYAELEYSLTVGGQAVTKAIRQSQKVEWLKGDMLRVKPAPAYPGQTVSDQERDLYYIGDKDKDGIPDIYCEHLSVANPIASRVSGFKCYEVEAGLWQIKLTGRWGEKNIEWETWVRQRSTMP